MELGSQSTGTNFRTSEPVDFRSGGVVSVYETDGDNNPMRWLIKKQVMAQAGTVKTFTHSFGTTSKFVTFELPDQNIIEILD